MTAEKYYFDVKNDIFNPFSHGVFSVSGLETPLKRQH